MAPAPGNRENPVLFRVLAGAMLGGVAAGIWGGWTLAWSGGGLPWGRPGLVFLLSCSVALVVAAAAGLILGLPLALLAKVPFLGRPVRSAGPFLAGLVSASLLVSRWRQGLPRGPLEEIQAGLKPLAALAVSLLLAWIWRRRPRLGIAVGVVCGLAGVALLARWERSPGPSPAPAPVFATSPAAGPPGHLRPRNVVVLLIDTLRADRLSCYGYPRPTSPRIDALAAGGVRFQQAVVQNPSTSPSVATLFSGTYPHRHGVVRVWNRLPERVNTLAEWFSGQGWQTAAILANHVLYDPFNFGQGFQHKVELDPGGGGPVALAVNQAALEWLEAHHRQPFFLYLHYLDPHTPYAPPEAFKGRFWAGPASAAPRLLEVGDTHFGMLRRDLMVENSRDPDLYRARYDEEIAYTDAVVGEFLDRLEALGHRDDTRVILTSDHGESLGDHAVYFVHGVVPFESNLRVPLIFRYPPLFPPRAVTATAAEMTDIFPTLAEVLALPAPEGLQGKSLAGLLAGGPDPGAEATFSEIGGTVSRLMQVVRTARHKLVFNPAGLDPAFLFRDPLQILKPEPLRKAWNAAHAGPGFNHRWALFDLAADPGEERNLLAEGRPLPAGLKEKLESWLGGADPGRAPELLQPTDLTPEMQEALKALGYAH